MNNHEIKEVNNHKYLEVQCFQTNDSGLIIRHITELIFLEKCAWSWIVKIIYIYIIYNLSEQ